MYKRQLQGSSGGGEVVEEEERGGGARLAGEEEGEHPHLRQPAPLGSGGEGGHSTLLE